MDVDIDELLEAMMEMLQETRMETRALATLLVSKGILTEQELERQAGEATHGESEMILAELRRRAAERAAAKLPKM